MSRYNSFGSYISVAKRQKNAEKLIGTSPIQIEGRTIASTSWGRAWCNNIESYSDFKNRLGRGRSYVRNGAVIDLQIKQGQVDAMVSGSYIYHCKIAIQQVDQISWMSLVKSCSGQIGSIVELLQGQFSKSVMEIITHRDNGLFPKPNEISLQCSCPDGAYLCKHLAAVLYGIGSRLDVSPELLFLLRQVNYLELMTAASKAIPVTKTKCSKKSIRDSELSDVFGIEIG